MSAPVLAAGVSLNGSNEDAGRLPSCAPLRSDATDVRRLQPSNEARFKRQQIRTAQRLHRGGLEVASVGRNR
jgi:hypothetical protein